jgi:hypothetical protein
MHDDIDEEGFQMTSLCCMFLYLYSISKIMSKPVEVGPFGPTTLGGRSVWWCNYEARGGRGKTQVSRSPEDKIYHERSFIPKANGRYRIEIPVSLSGNYDVQANQVGAGGRQAVVEISLREEVQIRSTKAYLSSANREKLGPDREIKPPIYYQKVTKGRENGPFKHSFKYVRTVEIRLNPQAEGKTEISSKIRLAMYAYAKWHKSYARLTFGRKGSPTISFGPTTVTML